MFKSCKLFICKILPARHGCRWALVAGQLPQNHSVFKVPTPPERHPNVISEILPKEFAVNIDPKNYALPSCHDLKCHRGLGLPAWRSTKEFQNIHPGTRLIGSHGSRIFSPGGPDIVFILSDQVPRGLVLDCPPSASLANSSRCRLPLVGPESPGRGRECSR